MAEMLSVSRTMDGILAVPVDIRELNIGLRACYSRPTSAVACVDFTRPSGRRAGLRYDYGVSLT